jgi:UDP-3-O-[3-hydroxymyristoyl] glucosamine N-acyltransferase
VAGHIEIGDDCTIGAKSGVSNTIKDKGIFTGYPPLPHGEWLRAKALFARLPELKKRIEELEERWGGGGGGGAGGGWAGRDK